MARDDAIFARCNVAWLFDPDCDVLTSNDVRWIHHVLWMISVKCKDSEGIPAKYRPEYLAKVANVDSKQFNAALKELTALGLISFTTDSRIYVKGVISHNSKLRWKNERPLSQRYLYFTLYIMAILAFGIAALVAYFN